jgi:L-alanine-DL-glutamate epimerase-like enolase superfamily enzyme
VKIRELRAYDLEIAYEQGFRPAWQPGLVRLSRDFTIVCVDTEEGITGYAGTDGHHSRMVERWVRPFLVGTQACAVESHANVFRNAGLQTAIWLDEEGMICAPEGAGLGIEVDEAELKRYRV